MFGRNMTPLHLWRRRASIRSWVVCVWVGAGEKRRADCSPRPFVCTFSHGPQVASHRCLFRTGRSPSCFSFIFFVRNSFFCLFRPPLTPTFLSGLCGHVFKLIYPSSDRVIRQVLSRKRANRGLTLRKLLLCCNNVIMYWQLAITLMSADECERSRAFLV